jgi:hypothetical protein
MSRERVGQHWCTCVAALSLRRSLSRCAARSSGLMRASRSRLTSATGFQYSRMPAVLPGVSGSRSICARVSRQNRMIFMRSLEVKAEFCAVWPTPRGQEKRPVLWPASSPTSSMLVVWSTKPVALRARLRAEAQRRRATQAGSRAVTGGRTRQQSWSMVAGRCRPARCGWKPGFF